MAGQSDPTRRWWRSVAWGHLVLLCIIVGVVLAYWFDARSTSLRLSNLLLVQPASLLALGLALVVLLQIFRAPPPDASEGVPAPESAADLARIAALAVAFGAMTLLLERLGFDIATFLFMVVALRLCGERRWWVLLVFSAVFTASLIYGYGALVPFPFPLTVL